MAGAFLVATTYGVQCITDMDAKEDIRARLSIEDVIGEYVQLKRAGRNWKGLSPFSAERTPSFVVSPDKQIWHDFSSGRGGDMFSFVMEMEGLDFRGALGLLARRAGVDLEQYQKSGSGRGPNAKSKERLYEALELASKFYQAQFSRNKTALEYVLSKRAFSKETALEWKLGYSPNNGSALIDFLRSKGYKDNELQLAGLTSKNYRGGLQDMFRGRLQIPLCDPQGRVIGFTARLLTDDKNAPKYINTPATPLYDKSRHVFGLHLAKEAIRKTKFVVLAEGNLDVIQSHQAGVRQVVATAGTALTEPHLKALSRFTGDIRLSFDADRAGLAATERAIPLAAKVGVSLSIITIPSGKDPDELIKQDADKWREVVGQSQYAVDWLIGRYTGLVDLKSAQGKRELSDVVLRVVRQLPDSVEQDHYLGVLAKLLEVSQDALREKLSQVDKTESKPVRQRKPIEQPKRVSQADVDKIRTEEHFLSLTLLQPSLRGRLEPLTEDMFTSEQAKEVFNFLLKHPDWDGKDLEPVQKFADYAKILSLVYETLYQDLDGLELSLEATRMQAKLVAQYVRIQKQLNTEALRGAVAADEEQKLIKRDMELTQLLRKYQGG